MKTYYFAIKFDHVSNLVFYKVSAANMTTATLKMLGIVGSTVFSRGLVNTWGDFLV